MSDIVRRFGTPLKFDKATIDGDFGHFARVLVDVDLAKPIKSSVLLECGDMVYEIKAVAEKLPEFCRACSTIGHSSADCWTLKKKEPTRPVKQDRGKVGTEGVVPDQSEAGEGNGNNESKQSSSDGVVRLPNSTPASGQPSRGQGDDFASRTPSGAGHQVTASPAVDGGIPRFGPSGSEDRGDEHGSVRERIALIEASSSKEVED